MDYSRLYVLRIFKINGIDEGPIETHYFKIQSGVVKRYNKMSPELGWDLKIAKIYKSFVDNPSMRK